MILFIVSYGILNMLVFEQGQTIESQRSLIKEMMKDSTQLATLKDKLARDDGRRTLDKSAAQSDRKNKDADAGTATVAPKALDKETKRPGKSAHVTKQLPSRPAADLEDVRRSTRVI